jgi:hypothetical protein
MDRIKEKPKLQTSDKTKVEVKSAEAEQFSMEFRADYNHSGAQEFACMRIIVPSQICINLEEMC